jgi:hypothetical protein
VRISHLIRMCLPQVRPQCAPQRAVKLRNTQSRFRID